MTFVRPQHSLNIDTTKFKYISVCGNSLANALPYHINEVFGDVAAQSIHDAEINCALAKLKAEQVAKTLMKARKK